MQDVQLFKKYKNQFLATCFILGGILIFIQVIVPSFQNILMQQEKNKQEEEKNRNIDLSGQLIKTSDLNLLQSNLSLSSKALPPAKDITGIYSALTSAAIDSDVVFDGFTVAPGGIYGGKDKEESGIPSVSVSARISNVDKASLDKFLQKLSNTSPLSEVVSLSLSSGTANIELKFFYKPYDLSAINTDIVLRLNSAEEEVLKKLREEN